MAPHSAPRLPRAHQRIFSRWHVGLQSAKSGGCLTTQQQQTSLLLYPPTPRKIEDKLRNLVITSFYKNVLSINHYGSCCACEEFLEIGGLNQSI